MTLIPYPNKETEPDTSDDANDPNTFYCANCKEYFPLTDTRGYYYRIQEVSEHICKEENATTTRSKKDTKG